MKGVVFTEFMDMVEDVFSADVLDHIIDESNLANGGSYTAVGTYDHQEIVRMTQSLSKHTNIPVKDLLEVFGKHLFTRFTHMYPSFFSDTTHVFDFFKKVDSYIHVEVIKLYPDAELPRFHHLQIDQTTLVLYYMSSRHFEDLAVGLIKGCLEYFNNHGHIEHHASTYEGEHAIKITITLL
jgi:hypothetical protein